MNHRSGGPAFARDGFDEEGDLQYGMTIRDYFAAQSLTGVLAGYPHDSEWPKRDGLAKLCYEYADAMLKERLRHV